MACFWSDICAFIVDCFEGMLVVFHISDIIQQSKQCYIINLIIILAKTPYFYDLYLYFLRLLLSKYESGQKSIGRPVIN